MDGWVVFFILLAAYLGLTIVLRARLREPKAGFELNGPFVMWRTQLGKRALEKVARPARFWNVVADAGIVLTWIVGALIFALVAFVCIVSIQQAFAAPASTAASAQPPQYLLGLPGINPLIPVGYGLLAIVLALIIHEGSHGVMAYASRMKVKSLGLLFFILPIGAFVEPDEEDLEKSTTREKNRVFAAGPTSNIVLAVVAGSLLALVFMGSVAVANDGHGVAIATVEPGSAAEQAGLQKGDIITALDGKAVNTRDDYVNDLNDTAAGQQIGIDYLRSGQTRHTEAVLGDRYDHIQRVAPDQNTDANHGKGFLGISGVPVSAIDAERDIFLHPFASPANFFAYNFYPLFIFRGIFADIFAAPYTSLFVIHGPLAALPVPVFFGLAAALYWIVWINVTLATFNALPMGPLDGGQMFRATLRDRLMRRYKVDPHQVHVERAELGGLKLSGRDADTQQKLDRINVVVKRTTYTLGFGILALLLVPILVPHVLQLFY